MGWSLEKHIGFQPSGEVLSIVVMQEQHNVKCDWMLRCRFTPWLTPHSGGGGGMRALSVN